jgi:hypothetical protein
MLQVILLKQLITLLKAVARHLILLLQAARGCPVAAGDGVMLMLVHLNWTLGWMLLLLGLLSGGLMGLFFHRPDFLGGYDSWPRRLFRLGHIACMALGMLNLIYAAGPHAGGLAGQITSATLTIGSISMPLVCFLSGWRCGLKFLFPLPVLALAVTFVLAFWSSL